VQAACTHLDQILQVEPRTPNGCEEGLKIGSDWVHLRLCLECGHVGCCDPSPNALRHYPIGRCGRVTERREKMRPVSGDALMHGAGKGRQ
jgi:hypothetical protein